LLKTINVSAVLYEPFTVKQKGVAWKRKSREIAERLEAATNLAGADAGLA
jgi:hypothetical protein